MKSKDFLRSFLKNFSKDFLNGVLDGFLDRILKVRDVLGNLNLPRLGASAGDFEDEALDGDDVSF